MQPTLEAPRLHLRPFKEEDATEVQLLAGDFRVADTTVNIPHPYPLEAAMNWIATHQGKFDSGITATFAVTTHDGGQLVGAIGLTNISIQHRRAELVYWIGVEFWGKGYCTEAVLRVMDFAREHYGVTKLVAHCFARNLASARVMEKAGMRLEGRLDKHIWKNGSYEDLLVYALVSPERQ